MKAPLSWIADFVTLPDDMSIASLASRLTMAGIEVEGISTIGELWEGVVAARIIDIAPLERHPGRWLVSIDTGAATATTVTSATELRVGDVVPFVSAGGRIGSGRVQSKRIGRVSSEGMLLSGHELGVSYDRTRIYQLDSDAVPGCDLRSIAGDTVLDLYLTPNRPDWMSVVGIAREIQALTDARWRVRPTPSRPNDYNDDGPISLTIHAADSCSRYSLVTLGNVRVAPAPERVRRLLHLAGIRSVSNVVDVTNFVMIERGQPMHAYDLSRLEAGGDGKRVMSVRRAHAGERLTMIDGRRVRLRPDDVVVAGIRRAYGVAGVIGGANTEITARTRTVALEAAAWDRATVRATATRLGFATEASRRFGRGVDAAAILRALHRAVELLTVSGSAVVVGRQEFVGELPLPRRIWFRPTDLNRRLGTEYSRGTIQKALRSLDFTIDAPPSEAHRADGAFALKVPSHRALDVEHVADLAEEVARVVGYDSIPATLPTGGLPNRHPGGDGGYWLAATVRRAMQACGLQEALTYSIQDPAVLERVPGPHLGQRGPRRLLRLVNPQSAEHSALRDTLLPGLVRTAQENRRHSSRVLLFEVGRTWRGRLAPLPRESPRLGIVMMGERRQRHWGEEASPRIDFFDLKGVVASLVRALPVPLDLDHRGQLHDSLHPGRSAVVIAPSAGVIGRYGQLHPAVAARFELGSEPVFVAELDFEALAGATQAGYGQVVKSPPRFPPATVNLAIVADVSTPHRAIVDVVRRAAGPVLESVELFDIYSGSQLPAGKRGLGYQLILRAADRTLEDQAIATIRGKVVRALADRLGVSLRLA